MKCKFLIFKLLVPIVSISFIIAAEATYAAKSCDGIFDHGNGNALGVTAVQLLEAEVRRDENSIQKKTERFASLFMPEYLKVTKNIQVKYKELKAVIEEYYTALEYESISESLIEFDPNKKFNNRIGDERNLYSPTIAEKLLSISEKIVPEALFRALYIQGRSDIERGLLLYVSITQRKPVHESIYKELFNIHSQLIEHKSILEKDNAKYDQALREESRESDEKEYNKLSKSMDQIIYEEGFDKELIGSIDRVRQKYSNKGQTDFNALYLEINSIVKTLKREHPLVRLKEESLSDIVDLLASVSNVPTEKILADLIYEVEFELNSGERFFDIYIKYDSLRAKLSYEH